MKSDQNDSSQWERVAAELRACREAQQRAWGDIDNTTLGRFLVGDVTPDEQRQIERSLDTLPELRKLTDLVRDVLGEADVPVSEPVSVPYGPTVLPYSQPALPARAATVTPRQPTTQRWKTSWGHGRVPQYASLAAAACLLLVLGVALPRSPNAVSSEPVTVLAYSSPVAERGLPVLRDDGFLGQIVAVGGPELSKDNQRMGDRLEKVNNPLVRLDVSVQALEAKGAKREATQLVRLYANNLARQALVYQEKGDLVAAEPALNQACRMCMETLGPQAPETIRTRQSLADFYEVALNTAPTAAYAFAADQTAPVSAASTDKEVLSSKEAEYWRNLHGGVNPYAIRGAQPYNAATPEPLASPLLTASGYAPTTSYTRPMKHGRSGYDHPNAQVARAKHSGRNAVPTQPTLAVVALRDHITRQTQAELKTSVVPVLTQALKDAKDTRERQRLERALGQLGPAARDAVPLLLDCYRQAPDSSERAVVLLTLGQIGPAARQAVPVLVDSLHHADRQVRDSAARALVLLGPVARPYGKDLDKKTPADPLIQHVVHYINSPQGRSGVEDDAECFSIRAIQQAQDQVRYLATNAQVEIRFETVRGKEALKAKKEELDQRTPHNCVFVCIDKEAPVAHVHFSDGLRKQGWSEARLQEALEPYLRKKQFDRGLLAGLQVLADFEKKPVKQ
jgi:hypothetical protein